MMLFVFHACYMLLLVIMIVCCYYVFPECRPMSFMCDCVGMCVFRFCLCLLCCDYVVCPSCFHMFTLLLGCCFHACVRVFCKCVCVVSSFSMFADVVLVCLIKTKCLMSLVCCVVWSAVLSSGIVLCLSCMCVCLF